MKIIVAGSRQLDSRLYQHRVPKLLWRIPPTELVCGMAKGPDTWGYDYGKENKIPVIEFPARWDLFGKRAGFLRNQEMATYADLLIAFWDGTSKGTKHMIDCMSLGNKPFHVELCLP